ncbi:MAG: NYN domain-containing protein [Acidobacteria bacterium]|nr:NYN domain-containing protein [Acidobacteriota bacterium]
MERLIVDGMNVIGSRPTGWWRDRDGAKRTFIATLQDFAEATGASVTVVLDGRPLTDVPEGSYDGVRVLYAPRRGRDAADDRIVELVEGDDEPETIVVVTSDAALRGRVQRCGAEVLGSSTFLRRVEASR